VTIESQEHLLVPDGVGLIQAGVDELHPEDEHGGNRPDGGGKTTESREKSWRGKRSPYGTIND
jgi:hypothetical protein